MFVLLNRFRPCTNNARLMTRLSMLNTETVYYGLSEFGEMNELMEW